MNTFTQTALTIAINTTNAVCPMLSWVHIAVPNKINDRYSKMPCLYPNGINGLTRGKDLAKFWDTTAANAYYNKNPVLFDKAVSGVEETWYEEAMDDDLIELKRLFGQI